MARYRYHDDWHVSSSVDCNFWIGSRTLSDALWIASLKGSEALITVHADCKFDGFETVAHVGLLLKALRGKSIEEIFAMFDEQVDEYIASRARTQQWGKNEAPSL